MTCTRVLVIALACSVIVASPALAQVPDTAADSTAFRLPGVRVEVARLGVGGIPLARTPFGADVIAAEELRAGPSLTVADALGRLPGVALADELGSAYQPDLTVRGFNVSPVVGLPQGVSVFVDGVRVNEPDASQVNFTLLPLGDLERVEVLRGPSGPFGKNTLGGAMHLVTRRGGPEPAGNLEAMVGSFGQLEGQARLSGQRGAFDYYVSGRYRRDEGWRDAAFTRTAQVFAKGGWKNGNTDLWVSYMFATDSLLQAGSVPISWLQYTDSIPPRWRDTDDPRKINFTGGDFFGPTLHFLTAQLSQRLSPQTELEANAFFRTNDIEQFNANFTEPDTRLITEIRSVGGTVQLAHVRGDLQLDGGVEYAFNDVGITIFEHPNENFPEIDEEGELSEDVGTDEHNVGAYLQARYVPVPRLAFTGMLRFDYVRLPFRDFQEPENDGNNTFRQLTGALGVDYVLRPGMVGFASYGRGFRAPMIMELACADPDDPCPLPYELGADPPLDPVTADTWQAGLRLFQGPFSADVVGFWSEVHDDIFHVQPPGARTGYFQNIERTRRQGLEVTLGFEPNESIEVYGALGLTRATFQSTATLSAPYRDAADDDEGEPPVEPIEEDDADDLEPPTVRPGHLFPMVPAVRAHVGVAYRRGPLRLGLQVDHVGSQWIRGDEDNTEEELKLDPYTLLDLHAEWRLLDGLTLFANVQNVLDTEYNTFGVLALNRLNDFNAPRVEPFVTPGFPRRADLGLRYRL
ncbi:MAG TPA: TonB-dependent receptor [Longimicrobiales bacterium]